MKTLTCTLPDGSTATRTTKHAYTHVCAVHDHRGWGALSWHKNETAARKNLAGSWGRIFYPTHKIVAVDAPQSAPAISKRNQLAANFWGVDLSVIPTHHIQG
jgi:hypothetical protein